MTEKLHKTNLIIRISSLVAVQVASDGSDDVGFALLTSDELRLDVDALLAAAAAAGTQRLATPARPVPMRRNLVVHDAVLLVRGRAGGRRVRPGNFTGNKPQDPFVSVLGVFFCFVQNQSFLLGRKRTLTNGRMIMD